MHNRYFLLLPALLLSQLTLGQQLRFGLKAGANYAKYILPNLVNDYQRRLGVSGGLVVRYTLPNAPRWALQPELLYTAKGARYRPRNAMPEVPGAPVRPFTQRLHYLDLPLLLRYTTTGVCFEAGPQLSTLLAGNTRGTDFGGPVNRRAYAAAQLALVAGVGYELPSGLSLNVRYGHDLTPLEPRDQSMDGRSYNSVFQAQAGYVFRARP
jgi:hypothetical protein